MMGELECPHWYVGSKNQPLSRTPTSVFQSSLPFMSQAMSMPIEPSTATTCVPSVTGVELACVDLVCRFTFGTPTCAVFSQRILPVALSSAYIFHVCSERSSTGATSPYSPVRNVLSPLLLIAVTANTLLPQ